MSSLGEKLRQEREKRGITIEQVASATKISVKLLHALESDQYSELPARPFIRGFVTSYARFIGIDAQEVLTQFGSYIDQKATARPSREGGHSGYAFERRDGEQSRAALWVVMGVFVVLGGIFIVVFKPALKHRKTTHAEKLRALQPSPSPSSDLSGWVPSVQASPAPSPSPSESSVAQEPSPSPSPSESPSPSPSEAPSPTPSPSPTSSKSDPLNSGADLLPSQIKRKLLFKALADVWVRYQIDARSPMKFILRKDRMLVLRATEKLVVEFGDPAALIVSPDSKPYIAVQKIPGFARRHGMGVIVFQLGEAVENAVNPFENDRTLPVINPTPRPPAPDVSPAN